MEQCGKNAFGGRGGWLIFQDFGVRDLWKTFDFACRIARFNALNYEDRIYAFENDVPYSFSIPAYSGNGYRIYLLFSANISRRLKCWIRYGNWIYKNVSSVGSGYESVSGNSQPQLSILISAKID